LPSSAPRCAPSTAIPTSNWSARAPGFDEALYARVATDAAVALASPIVEGDTFAFDAGGARVPLRVLGVDALVVAPLSPAVLPRPDAGADRFSVLDPASVFLNAAAARRLASSRPAPTDLVVQAGTGRQSLRIAGSVAAAARRSPSWTSPGPRSCSDRSAA
jgi:putative ABC transport system permease protein